ncbi:toast rack family protein [Cytobacillus dafuensis]|uniref:DUF2154 domain-containing protein n=1 Tax=Cytobacillus dafuensis TaxID=1742359 RepID=A0A5B8Z8N5_CYTDA|nr:toast rack family protein [Cytobacillus dafuensis]QED49308.1 hypothetical protein FSZ17_19720 [Cytobacillus dafuensis]
MTKKLVLGIIIAANLLWITGCSYSVIGKEKDFEIHVQKDKAEKLDITLDAGIGEINVSGGAKDWAEGVIEYNIDELKPKVKYKRTGNTGKMTIEQSDGKVLGIKKGSIKNTWDLQLTNDVPINLEVNTGTTDTDLDLQGLKLSKLDIDGGVGDITVDLSGDWQESFDVDLEMGVGQSTIILPKDVGVKIISSEGVGSSNFNGFISEGNGVYVNEAFENADVKIVVNTELGVGEANFELEK